METPIKDYQQAKVTRGQQKVILNPKETAETDDLDPKFADSGADNRSAGNQKPQTTEDADTELI